MRRSIVVTGGGRGVGRGICQRLLQDSDRRVVVLEQDPAAVEWMSDHPDGDRLHVVTGDASDPAAAGAAAEMAEAGGVLAGWVNNAAVFRDLTLHDSSPSDVMGVISNLLAPAVTGSAVAVRRFLAAGTGGAIVNLSSHQATRPVRGALPYATAKAAIEGLTRSVAVDYGPQGVRCNAVALGSIVTDRLTDHLAGHDNPDGVKADLRRLHPLGRPGTVAEAAAAVAYLLSDDASFINGAILPVDGGRSVLGLDPEAG